MESKTPRTDAQPVFLTFSLDENGHCKKVISIDFARQLETELATAKKEYWEAGMQVGEMVIGLQKTVATQAARIEGLERELTDSVEVLEFYADPDTYFAIGFFPDPPCGEFMEDFSDTGELGFKPGKRARDLFDKYADTGTAPTHAQKESTGGLP